MAAAATMNGNAHDTAPVLAALSAMSSTANREHKSQAHAFLEAYQKSPDAWNSTVAILQSSDPSTTVEARLFAATTLKGKIIFDFAQLRHLGQERVSEFQIDLLKAIALYASGPKPIRTQLCVCLANLAILMLEWKDAVQTIVNTLNSIQDGVACILEFLHVLPEEVTEGRKIALGEEQLKSRTAELLEDNGQYVVGLLTQYSQSSLEAKRNPLLMECITSWIREVPLSAVVDSPLMDAVVVGLGDPTSFDAAVETMCAMFRETRDVQEYKGAIEALFLRLSSLVPNIRSSAEEEDWEAFKGWTRLFAEAAEAWVILLVQEPGKYQSLAEWVLQCCQYDKEREAVSRTFYFWNDLKQYLTTDRYFEVRCQYYVIIYKSLVDNLIIHLQYPDGGDADLFDGDREAEDRFREFRHDLGDVLKDCCEVIGVTECLKKSYDLIMKWVADLRSGHSSWQKLEAPLFSMRAIGRQVPKDEKIMLRQLIPLIMQTPDHEKVRFQAVMALGRYTEWTAQNCVDVAEDDQGNKTLEPSQMLKDQLNFIWAAFQHPSAEVVKAAALSLRFFCNDCADLLKNYLTEIQRFYNINLDTLPTQSKEELTEGVASVVARQPLDRLYQSMKLCCDPLLDRLKNLAQTASDENGKSAVADHLGLLTTFIEYVTPWVELSQPHPAVQYCAEMFPVLSAICDGFIGFVPIVERVCRCWRNMVLSYRIHARPLLPELANKLRSGFEASRQGCFLWATDSIVREFSDISEYVDHNTTDQIYVFYEQQATTFLIALSEVPPENLPDLIEDFFRLSTDVLLYHPDKLLASNLLNSILSAASTSLTLLKEEPLIATLHFLRDFLAYGSDDAPSPAFDATDGTYANRPNPPQTKASVRAHIEAQGESLVQRCMTGMMYSFTVNCLTDASGVLLALFELAPPQVAIWVGSTVGKLPPGSITIEERDRLSDEIADHVRKGEMRKIRAALQKFTQNYRKRNVAPREGLGELEGEKFQFKP